MYVRILVDILTLPEGAIKAHFRLKKGRLLSNFPNFPRFLRDIKFMLLVSPKPIVSPQLLLSCNIFSFSGNGVNDSSKM